MPKRKLYTGATITIELPEPPYYLPLPTPDVAVAGKVSKWAQELKVLIRRRVDELEAAEMTVDLIVSETCDACGAEWTERSTTFNGGCCDADMLNAPAICGFCDKPGADKIPHPVRWPGEESAGTEYVHEECENREQERAHAKLTDHERERFLRTVAGEVR